MAEFAEVMRQWVRVRKATASSGEEIEKGYVTQWRDYDNSDVVQVLVNGKYYLTHYSNVVLISDPSLSPMAYSNSSMFGVDE